MIILGVNAYHADAAAAVVKDGVVAAAAEEERFNRIKHWAGIPTQAIRFCLDHCGINFADVDYLAINTSNSAHRKEKFLYMLKSCPHPGLVIDKLRSRRKRKNILDELALFPGFDTAGVKCIPVEHHTAHLASAYYPSEFESAAVLSIDGFGDFSSSAWGIGENGQLVVKEYVHFPDSLGVFYQAITQFIGFPAYGDEYKIMGLAPYGSVSCLPELEKVLVIDGDGGYSLTLDYFRHHRESLAFHWDGGAPEFENLFTCNLERLLGPCRKPGEPITDIHKNIAATAQYLYEKALLSMLHRINRESGQTSLALAGGCAMNSVANGKIIDKTPFRKVYVQPAAGDAGGAVGAALWVWKENGGEISSGVMPNAYLGPSCSNESISALLQLENVLDDSGYKSICLEEEELLETVAREIMAGSVVGWFQGRMEWGPRALGNRSILADPRRNDIQDLLNSKIKRRESFRPFAPSILEECTAQWFDTGDTVPFMEKVYPVKEDKRTLIPAVTHVDGTGRLQTVSARDNPRYHRLISVFYKLTGVPVLLNTSFNENEPIVCNPQEALDCFRRTRMDVLVMQDFLLRRKS